MSAYHSNLKGILGSIQNALTNNIDLDLWNNIINGRFTLSKYFVWGIIFNLSLPIYKIFLI